MTIATEPIRTLRRRLTALAPDGLSKHDLLSLRALFVSTLAAAETAIEDYLINDKENISVTTATLTNPSNVDAKLAQFAADNFSAFRELAIALAEGKDVEAEKILSIVQAAGRTVDDLKHCQAKLRERLEAVLALQESAQLGATLADLKSQREAAIEELEGLKAKHREELKPLVAKADRAIDAYRDVEHRSESLRREGTLTINRTSSRASRAQFDRLSNAMHQTKRAWESLKSGVPQVEGRIAELKLSAEAVSRDIEVHDRKFGRGAPSHSNALRMKFQKKLDSLRDEIARERQFGDKVTAAWQRHRDATAALEQFCETESRNWQNIDWSLPAGV